MINLSFPDKNTEEFFFDHIKGIVDKFNNDFLDNVEIHKIEDDQHSIESLLEMSNEEVNRIRDRFDLISCIRRKMHQADELRENIIKKADPFECYNEILKQLLAFLERKPIENTEFITTLENVETYKYSLGTLLSPASLQAIETLIKLSKDYRDTPLH